MSTITLKAVRSINKIAVGAHSVLSGNKYYANPGFLAYQGTQILDSKRYFTVTPRKESALIVGGLGIVAAAVAVQYAHSLYVSFESKKASEPATEEAKTDGAPQAPPSEEAKADNKTDAAGDTSSSQSSSWFARNFYEGGFEEKMTKREAALILGVRESATPERIKEAHRRILLLNHPDRGGSAFIAAKINEAKDILMKGK